MKILQLIPNISGGGAERFTVDLSNELSADNDVYLLTLYDPQDSDIFREELDENISTYSVGKEWGFDCKIFTRLYNTIKKIDPDIIHTHLRSINYLMPLYPLLQIPFIHTVHSDAYEECKNNLIRASRKLFFKNENAVPVTISEESQQSFEKAYSGINAELIYNGRAYPHKSSQYTTVVQDIENLKSDNKTKVFVHIGRMAAEKNQLMLVRAFNRLVYREKANTILLIIGGRRNNDKSRKIQQQLKEAEREHDHIHLFGERSNATDYLHAADFFCLSSLYEGMPITLIEAFATGCIPVCTPVGGVKEMVKDLDHSLVSYSVDMKDYYQVIRNGTSFSKVELSKLKERSLRLFEKKYSIKYSSNNYYSLYKQTL